MSTRRSSTIRESNLAEEVNNVSENDADALGVWRVNRDANR